MICCELHYVSIESYEVRESLVLSRLEPEALIDCLDFEDMMKSARCPADIISVSSAVSALDIASRTNLRSLSTESIGEPCSAA